MNENKLYFFASDIHSHFDEWSIALKSKGFDINNKNHIVGVCGDLFDRGSQTIECYEFIKKLHEENRLVYVHGNHEDLLEMCAKEIKRGCHISRHHISNGTIRTISHFIDCSDYDIMCGVISFKEISEKLDPVLSFINNVTVNYYELGNKVFVHGWVPTSITSEENHTTCVPSDWRDGDWFNARWENGMEMAHFGLTIPDKTVVCGHWHTSWGHSRYHNDGDEWDGTTANFSPYYDNGIIAIDACTAYTHMVNVVVFDEHGNEVK